MTYDITYTFRVEGMHCASCGLLIDDILTDLPGVHRSDTTVRTGLCTVDAQADRCAPEGVISAVGELGYNVRLEEAVPK